MLLIFSSAVAGFYTLRNILAAYPLTFFFLWGGQLHILCSIKVQGRYSVVNGWAVIDPLLVSSYPAGDSAIIFTFATKKM